MVAVFGITAISGWLQKRAQAAQEAGDSPNQGHDPAARQARPKPSNRPESAGGGLEAQLRRWLEKEFTPPPPPPLARTAPPIAPGTTPTPERVREPSVTAHAQALENHLEHTEKKKSRGDTFRNDKAAVYHWNKGTSGGKSRATGSVKKHRRSEITAAVDMMRNPSSVRQAYIASFILASPKGLED